jgi:hypothetical protein
VEQAGGVRGNLTDLQEKGLAFGRNRAIFGDFRNDSLSGVLGDFSAIFGDSFLAINLRLSALC